MLATYHEALTATSTSATAQHCNGGVSDSTDDNSSSSANTDSAGGVGQYTLADLTMDWELAVIDYIPVSVLTVTVTSV
jgi:hypothetical protein